MENTNRFLWIDGLKGIACFGVFGAHFLSSFYTFSSVGQAQTAPFVKLFINYFCALFQGDMWVYVFCMLSGYLIARTRVDSFKKLAARTYNRYLRFALPFAVLGVFVWLLSLTAGINKGVYAEYFNNTWIGGDLVVSIKDVLRFTFLFDSRINGNIWVVKDIFLGNVLIYFFDYVCKQIPKEKLLAEVFFSMALFAVSARWIDAVYIGAVLFGAALRLTCDCFIGEKDLIKSAFVSFVLLLFWYMMVSCGHRLLFSKLFSFIGFSESMAGNIRWWFFYSILLILLVKYSAVKEMFGGKAAQSLGKISFEIYLLHPYVLYKIAMPLQIRFIDLGLSYTAAMIIDFLITSAGLFILSALYKRLADAITSKAMERIAVSEL